MTKQIHVANKIEIEIEIECYISHQIQITPLQEQ